MTRILVILTALAAFAACLIVPILYFLGRTELAGFHRQLLGASLIWFIFATWWTRFR